MIYGDRIRLRSVERSDLPRFFEWLNDPEVTAGLSMVLPLSQADEEAWFDQMMMSPPDQHALVIEAHQEAAWLVLGNCSFMNIDYRNRSGEIGIFIGRKDLWNLGYGTETMRLMLKHGFNTLNLHRIYLRVFASNTRAIRAYEKAGFVHEGRLRDADYRDGVYADVLIMSVLKPEWKA
ncbi:MAG TPA: GNAT family protein [Anaerolineales bacterium]